MELQTAEHLMKLVLVTVLADGTVAQTERALIRRLQEKLGIDDNELRCVVDEVRGGGDPDAWLPQDPDDRRKALRLMVIAAQIDGRISDVERALLVKTGSRLGFDNAAFEGIFREGMAMANRYRGEGIPSAPTAESPELRHRAEAIVQQWRRSGSGPTTLREQISELERIGAPAVVPLVRAFESYLRPAPPATLARVKEALAEALGRIGDPRAVYYLATFLLMGDDEDETNDADLRAAVAEAIGRIVGEPFARNADGVVAARAWWSRGGSRRYQTLIS
jgi:uncharacterized tellurite resistance protein B-like protein